MIEKIADNLYKDMVSIKITTDCQYILDEVIFKNNRIDELLKLNIFKGEFFTSEDKIIVKDSIVRYSSVLLHNVAINIKKVLYAGNDGETIKVEVHFELIGDKKKNLEDLILKKPSNFRLEPRAIVGKDIFRLITFDLILQ